MHSNVVIPTVALAVLVVGAATASADAVFLTNGRVLYAERARVIGATVYIDFCGGKIQLALERVEVIEPGPVPETEACATGTPTQPVLGKGLDDSVRSGDEPVGADGEAAQAAGVEADAAAETTGPNTREYWRQRIDPIRERIARIDTELERLPRYRPEDMRIIIHGGNLRIMERRARYERIKASWEELLRATLREARRAGVPPGWLRR